MRHSRASPTSNLNATSIVPNVQTKSPTPTNASVSKRLAGATATGSGSATFVTTAVCEMFVADAEGAEKTCHAGMTSEITGSAKELIIAIAHTRCRSAADRRRKANEITHARPRSTVAFAVHTSKNATSGS